MYLYLGSDTVVCFEDVIGIFDLERASLGKWTRAFLAQATKQEQVINVSYEMPKAFVVTAQQTNIGESTEDKQSHTVYITQVASTTIARRAKGW